MIINNFCSRNKNNERGFFLFLNIDRTSEQNRIINKVCFCAPQGDLLQLVPGR